MTDWLVDDSLDQELVISLQDMKTKIDSAMKILNEIEKKYHEGFQISKH